VVGPPPPERPTPEDGWRRLARVLGR
jgi:hypothetical protein